MGFHATQCLGGKTASLTVEWFRPAASWASWGEFWPADDEYERPETKKSKASTANAINLKRDAGIGTIEEL